MTDHRIVCGIEAMMSEPTWHTHIVEVGVSGFGPDKSERKFAIADVLAMMNDGHTFHVLDESSGKVAYVTPVQCDVCRHRIIRSAYGAIVENDVERLPNCAG